MLTKRNPVKNQGGPSFSRQIQRFAAYRGKRDDELHSIDAAWAFRIAELEAEIARLHATVQFFQDLYILDD